VAALLDRSGVGTSLVVIETTGDRELEVPLDRLGGRGIFVKEVQAAVLGNEADLAVHSAKDLPAAPELAAPGLVLAAFPERADPRDVLVGARIDSLPVGSLIATGSARRRAQLADLRPDLNFAGLRGNLATRLSKVGVSGVTAVVAAKAALDRLEWAAPAGLESEVLDVGTMVPQVGQGALAVECREDDQPTRNALAAIDDAAVRRLVGAERAFLAELGGGCTLPVGAYATYSEDTATDSITLSGMIASGDGVVVLRHQLTGNKPDELGRAVARYLLDSAGGSALGDWESDVHDSGDRSPTVTR
jgi:hydroxymethylbilane synthase